jgi:hypothetical protein
MADIVDSKLNSMIREAEREYADGFLCLFDVSGKVLYANHKFNLVLKEKSFYGVIPLKERSSLIELFTKVHREREVTKNVFIALPLTVGKYDIGFDKVKCELVAFAEGLLLKIPADAVKEIAEIELEKLKRLLRAHPNTGFWLTDQTGTIVDCLKENCRYNLGWKESDLLGKNISLFNFNSAIPKGRGYEVERLCKGGGVRKTEFVLDDVVLSNGNTYHVYLDTYFR